MNELALFAGIGGGILGGQLLGWRTVCAVENDGYAVHRLLQRQDEGFLPTFPIWDDVRTFGGKEWQGNVDVVSGGFPCQDISIANQGKGINGERSGLWNEMARVIGEVKPLFVFVENSPAITRRGLEKILSDLASMGYDAEWGVLGAGQVGAPHQRDRFWLLGQIADPNCNYAKEYWERHCLQNKDRDVPTEETRWAYNCFGIVANLWWTSEPPIPRVDDGTPYRLDRHRVIGNAQVPRVAGAAFLEMIRRLGVKDFESDRHSEGE